MTRDTLIHSATLMTDGRIVADAWVRMQAGRIAHIGAGRTWHEALPQGIDVVDAGGAVLAPGFVDIHGHGGGGHSYDEGMEQALTALDAHLAHGTTRQVMSLVAGPVDVLAAQLDAVRQAQARDPRVLGAHLEGPFFSPAHKGAHRPDFLSEPTPDRVARLIEAGVGVTRQITLAPELPGGLEAVDAFVAAGVRVAVGHSDADYAQASAAFDRGASILTHAFNAMRSIHHRAPGPVVAALDRPRVTIEAISDGVHVHPSVLRMLCEAAPGRVALITDAMAAAAAPDGDYLLGTLPVRVTGGVARLAEGQIAGSTLTLERAVQVATREVGLPLERAIEAATSIPARALGLDDEYGSLAPGRVADAVLLDEDATVTAVWLAGERVA